MTVVSKKNAEHFIWGEQCDGWHLAKTENLSIILERVPSGCSEIRHLHNQSEQYFFVLSGIATLELNGVRHQIYPNQGILVPPQTPHQLLNEDDENLDFIVTSTPPSHGDRVEV